MTKGLVRANNLADLSSKQDSLVNLGLAIADYDALRSLYTTAGLDFSVIGGIAGSTGNYQAQIDGISSTLSGIVLSGFVNRQGNSLISTSWTNSDGIISISGVLSGYSPSSGTTFALSIEQGEAVITTSGLSANDLAYNSFRQANSTVVRASPPSGFNTLQLIPLQVGGQSFFVQASETPSFHIAPARMGHALDLVTGNLLGTYNSASPAWAVGPDGVLFQPAANAPVIEYDSVTLRCFGARIWDVVLNLSLHSRDLTQAAWSKSGITPTRDQVGANGVSNTATRLTATSSDGTCLQTITSASATRVSGFYIRRITGTGTVEITQNGGATWTAVSLTSTFARYSIASATITNPQIGFRIRSNGDEIAVDFAQLQSASTLGPPVPTTTLAASSTADAWSITGADFSRIINQTEGTIYIEYGPHDVLAPGSNNSLFTITASTTTAADIIESWVGSSIAPVTRVQSNSVNQVSITSLNYSPSAIHKLAAAYKADDFARSLDTQPIGTDTSGALPAVAPSILEIGTRNLGGVKPLNGYIRELAIFRSRRPNANLQAMTQ